MRFILLMLCTLCMACVQKENKTTVLPLPEKEVVFSGLNKPWSIAFLSEKEVLVTEKNGGLLRINLESKARKVIKGFPMDLTDSIGAVHFGDNSGMYEVITHPDFNTNYWIYVSYTSKKLGVGRTTKFIRAKLEADSLTQVQDILIATPYTKDDFHFGGGMVFGTDRKLYLTVGERLFWERDEPQLPIAQNVSDPRGKIFRFNDDGSIPEDNPDFGKDAVPGLYAIGLRNSQGIAVQPETNVLWFTEHGTIQGDEINRLESGANYGWPASTTGRLRSKDYEPPKISQDELTAPTWFWPHTVAPTGLCFYTGDEFPHWKNNLIVPGLSRGSLWRFQIEGVTIKSAEELFIDDRVRSRKVRQSPDGKLYMLTDEEDGKIIRIKPINNLK
ncbi:PQQ-dependent sugar dehydrogenase [uncultured Croceitalea sp.]|uniref:PQQ-dependent sugar dehydrogenase n=1 Tax=uncultured Croceitalea sp. TaxID=1798908 RepID=UPI003305DDCB